MDKGFGGASILSGNGIIPLLEMLRLNASTFFVRKRLIESLGIRKTLRISAGVCVSQGGTLLTAAEGHFDGMHIGMAGTMNVRFVNDPAATYVAGYAAASK
ncbi:hypothetical protein [Rhodophyticola sp.]|uniref:hypothetical protein n=1 Tax=Rhodophyticola sp. TaxID=2680032 RepID=UPI003D2BB0D9